GGALRGAGLAARRAGWGALLGAHGPARAADAGGRPSARAGRAAGPLPLGAPAPAARVVGARGARAGGAARPARPHPPRHRVGTLRADPLGLARARALPGHPAERAGARGAARQLPRLGAPLLVD